MQVMQKPEGDTSAKLVARTVAALKAGGYAAFGNMR